MVGYVPAVTAAAPAKIAEAGGAMSKPLTLLLLYTTKSKYSPHKHNVHATGFSNQMNTYKMKGPI